MSIETVQSRLGNHLKSLGLDTCYDPVRTRAGDVDKLTVYIAGTRKRIPIFGITYGGTVVAEIEVTARSSSSYQNGVIRSVRSDILQIPEAVMRQIAEGKLVGKVSKPADSTVSAS